MQRFIIIVNHANKTCSVSLNGFTMRRKHVAIQINVNHAEIKQAHFHRKTTQQDKGAVSRARTVAKRDKPTTIKPADSTKLVLASPRATPPCLARRFTRPPAALMPRSLSMIGRWNHFTMGTHPCRFLASPAFSGGTLISVGGAGGLSLFTVLIPIRMSAPRVGGNPFLQIKCQDCFAKTPAIHIRCTVSKSRV
jgi:hypothetical protein